MSRTHSTTLPQKLIQEREEERAAAETNPSRDALDKAFGVESVPAEPEWKGDMLGHLKALMKTQETVTAQHEETGRTWEGPSDQIPRGYSQVETCAHVWRPETIDRGVCIHCGAVAERPAAETSAGVFCMQCKQWVPEDHDGESCPNPL
jgi:hypothetical protein